MNNEILNWKTLAQRMRHLQLIHLIELHCLEVLEGLDFHSSIIFNSVCFPPLYCHWNLNGLSLTDPILRPTVAIFLGANILSKSLYSEIKKEKKKKIPWKLLIIAPPPPLFFFFFFIYKYFNRTKLHSLFAFIYRNDMHLNVAGIITELKNLLSKMSSVLRNTTHLYNSIPYSNFCHPCTHIHSDLTERKRQNERVGKRERERERGEGVNWLFMTPIK